MLVPRGDAFANSCQANASHQPARTPPSVSFLRRRAAASCGSCSGPPPRIWSCAGFNRVAALRRNIH